MKELKNSVRNNLFDFATRELSHDAFLCWLFNSKNGEDRVSEEVSLALFNRMLNSNYQKIDDVKVNKQVSLTSNEIKDHSGKYITGTLDVIVNVQLDGQKFIVIIEDKVDAYETNNQLSRYPILVREKYDASNQIVRFVFITLGNKPSPVLRKIGESTEWNVLTRNDILVCIGNILGNNDLNSEILEHYYSYLQSWSTESTKFKEDTILDWSSKAIQGFYEHIVENDRIVDLTKRDANWGYVNRYSDGFWGFWWSFSDFKWNNNSLIPIDQSEEGKDHIKIYLQIELTNNASIKPCCAIKISFDDQTIESKTATTIRDYLLLKLFDLNKDISDNHVFTKTRRSSGKTITLARYTFDNNSYIIVENTLILLRKRFEEFLKKIVACN